MKKVSMKEMDQRKSRYYTIFQFYARLREACKSQLGFVNGNSAVCLVLMGDGYEAFFHDALVVSQLTGLPVTPDFGFIRCDVTAVALNPTIEAIHKDDRAVFVLDIGRYWTRFMSLGYKRDFL